MKELKNYSDESIESKVSVLCDVWTSPDWQSAIKNFDTTPTKNLDTTFYCPLQSFNAEINLPWIAEALIEVVKIFPNAWFVETKVNDCLYRFRLINGEKQIWHHEVYNNGKWSYYGTLEANKKEPKGWLGYIEIKETE